MHQYCRRVDRALRPFLNGLEVPLRSLRPARLTIGPGRCRSCTPTWIASTTSPTRSPDVHGLAVRVSSPSATAIFPARVL